MDFSRSNKKLWWLLLAILVLVIVVVVVVVLVVVLKDNKEDPEVTISQGTLRGVNLVTHHNREIYAFKGIPFAEPPVGNLRFRAPVAPGPWDGTLDASKDSNDCVQPDGTSGNVIGDEDCLYLHVYTPKLPSSEDTTLLPVMMFIYGGAFREGGNWPEEYGPEYLLDKDVVLIVPTYRLGMFGFLSTGDEVSPGNYGLKDVVRALEWNRDNIAAFGGDPNRVTLFGQSAGGMVCQLMALSSLTEGLFHGYVTQSGTALSYDAHRPVEVLADRAIQVGEHLGCPTGTSTELVECLRGIDPADIIATNSLFIVWNHYPNIAWSPTIEPDIEGAFLTEKPGELIRTGRIHDVPYLSSVNRDEGINHAVNLYENPDLLDDFIANIDIALPVWLTYDSKVANVTAYTEALKSYYFNDLTVDRQTLLTNFTQLMGDALCGFPTYSVNQKLVAYSTQPQFVGSFEYRGTLTYIYSDTIGNIDETSVAHADEIIYLFPLERSVLGPEGTEMNEADLRMLDIMVELWTSFAIDGVPSLSGSTVTWERYSAQENYLQIGNYSDTSISAQAGFLADRMQFWEELTAATTWL